MLSQVAPWGTGESRGEDLTIWLTTFGPGSEIEYWWGHSALVVEDGRLIGAITCFDILRAVQHGLATA